MAWTTEELWINPQKMQDICLLSKTHGQIVGPHNILTNVTGVSIPGAKEAVT